MVEEEELEKTGLVDSIVETAEIIVAVAKHMMVHDQEEDSVTKEEISDQDRSGSIKSNSSNEDLKGADLFRALRDEASEALEAMKEDMRSGHEVPATAQFDAAIREQMLKEHPAHLTGTKLASGSGTTLVQNQNLSVVKKQSLKLENMEAEQEPEVEKVLDPQENAHEKRGFIEKVKDTAHNMVQSAKNLVHRKKSGKEYSHEAHASENTEADSKKEDEDRLKEMREDATEAMKGMKEDVSHGTNVPIVNEMDAAIRGSMINEDPYNTDAN